MLNITASAIKAEKETPLSIVAEQKDGKATIRIMGYINEWGSANAVDLGVQIDALNEVGYTEATVYINTKGGQTWEANEIVNELRRFKGKLHGEGRAMVFSAGTYIACKLDTFKVHPNTQWMWHKPQANFEGTYDEIASNMKALKSTEADYLKVYAAKTGKTEKELDALWAKGDQWLMGQEVVDFGFADGLIADDAPVTEADVKALTACGAPVVPVATAKDIDINKTENQKGMKIDPTSIGLSATATEAEVNAKLIELKAGADEATALKAEKLQKETADLSAKIEAVLDQGQKDRKFGTEMRAELKTVLEANFEAGEKIIKGMAAVPDVDASLEGSFTPTADRKDWDLKKWQSEDPKGLEAAGEKDPKFMEKLVEAAYKK
jgi:ATP-dependent protease ClpP protease subunit